MKISEAFMAVVPPDATEEEREEALQRQGKLSAALWAPGLAQLEVINNQRVKGISHWFSYN